MEHRKVRKLKGAGIELNCVDYGGEGGPPILLVHGGAAHARWWDFVAPALTGRFHVLALDQRGHGDSPWTGPWAYGSRHYAADLEAVIDGWGLGAPVLVGHSMGGHSVMACAVEHSDRLRAMVAIDSIPTYPEHAVAALSAIADRPASVYESLHDAVASFRLLPAETLAPPEILRHVAELSFRQRADGKWVHKMDRLILRREPVQLDGVLERIRCPALLIKAALSPVLAASLARAMAARMAHGRMIQLENSNHHVPIDNPSGLVAAMSPFLAEVVDGAPLK
ncbi:MAG TPA: alpha/beta hydrolase [Candidatus Binataceae bacterium]|nr:alpha/beta hydrolase [Candidatus Binataceae bacterium]